MTPDNSGRLIVVEGPDGSGKSSLIASLERALCAQGIDAHSLREPGGTTLSEHLRSILKGDLLPGTAISDRAETLLFAAARAQIVEEVITPGLQNGQWLLLDRFEGSTLIYQGLARGLGIDAVRQLSRFASDGLVADFTLLLSLSKQSAAERMDQRSNNKLDRIESAGDSFYDAVHHGYQQLASYDLGPITVLDAEQSSEAILSDALAALKPLLPLLP